MHHGRSETLLDAIGAHSAEADAARVAFLALTPGEQSALLQFLASLSARGRTVAALTASLLMLASACAAVSLLEVRGPDGTLRLRVEADFARTAAARREGLAARDGLDDGRGLLLVFPTEGEVCIENTPWASPSTRSSRMQPGRSWPSSGTSRPATRRPAATSPWRRCWSSRAGSPFRCRWETC
ncbi:MAG: DUF192 domain-containing protein [Sandaracinaceae bacterium]|nr:DUF192 domain-containing protein [Sandaracinaceae bacterium]